MSKYSKNFKDEAVRLSDEIGPKKASQQLGIPYYNIADWRKRRNYETKNNPPLTEAQSHEKIQQLEKENAELRKANDILKDAIGFFAKDRKM